MSLSRKPCSVSGCDRPHHARTWCLSHYMRWRNHGDPLAAVPIMRHPRLADLVASSQAGR